MFLERTGVHYEKHHRHFTQYCIRYSGFRGKTPPSRSTDESTGAAAKHGVMGPTTAADHQQYVKALRESGYNPKNDYQSNGVVRDHLP